MEWNASREHFAGKFTNAVEYGFVNQQVNMPRITLGAFCLATLFLVGCATQNAPKQAVATNSTVLSATSPPLPAAQPLQNISIVSDMTVKPLAIIIQKP